MKCPYCSFNVIPDFDGKCPHCNAPLPVQRQTPRLIFDQELLALQKEKIRLQIQYLKQVTPKYDAEWMRRKY